MSWSTNWPTKVDPAVIVGLSGLVPYGFDAVGLPFTLGSRISAFGPADRRSPASMIPPGLPTSSSAARTRLFASANGGKFGQVRPNSALLAGTPRPRAYEPPTGAGVDAASAGAANPALAPTEPATSLAPVAPRPFRKSRRDGPCPRVSALICLPFLAVTGVATYRP